MAKQCAGNGLCREEDSPSDAMNNCIRAPG